MVRLIRKKIASNDYSGSNWNHELTTKYVLEINDKIVEAGYFIHYLKQIDGILQLVKVVIELPSSVGCPVKCAFCASSFIQNIKELSADEIYQIFCFIYNENEVTEKDYLLVTMTGIGDYALFFNNVNKAIAIINENYQNVHFTVSSSVWTEKSVEKVIELSDMVDMRAINITYVSCDKDRSGKIIKWFEFYNNDFQKVIERFAATTLQKMRINYIMIKDINDSLQDFESFVRICEPIKTRLVVRISKLNTTEASTKAKLCPVDCSVMEQFRDYLKGKGFNAYLFYSYKEDQMNCGQLLLENQNVTV